MLVAKPIKGRGDYRPTSANRIRGRGDYFGDLLGGLGSKIGNTVQGAFRDITGFGDYRTHGPKSNSLAKVVARAADTSSHNLGTAGPSQNPFVMGAMSVQFGGKAPRIQHREFISNIVVPASGDAFHTTAYSIQPGLSGPSSLFPWGSSVFGNFENYRMHGLVLEYATTSSNFSASSALGSVSMSTIYDAEAPILTTLSAVNNNEFTTTAPPCSSFYHPVECAPSKGATDVKFIRKGNSAVSETDTRFDDVGVFQLSLDGLSAPPGTVIGQLWASYDIEVLKAVLPDLHLGTTSHWTFLDSTAWSDFFSNPVANPSNSLPATITSSADQMRIHLPKGYNGNYCITLTWVLNGASPLPAGSSRSVYVSGAGTDISYVDFFPSPWATFNGTHFALDNQYQGTSSVAISTIAEDAGQNYIDFTLSAYGEHSFGGVYTTLSIVPLDNDVVGDAARLSSLMRKNPALATMAKLMTKQAKALAPAPTGSKSGGTSCAPPTANMKAAVAASSVPVPVPSFDPKTESYNTISQLRLMKMLTETEYEDDKWIDVDKSGSSKPPSSINRPSPNQCSPAQPGHQNLAVALAEERLAAAIRAATIPSATLLNA